MTFARAGARVVLHGRDEGALAGVRGRIAEFGGEAITQDVAAEVGPYGIRANCLAPETILTGRNAREIPPDIQRVLVGVHPLRRLGTPDDVAGAALFLASEESSWITGVILDVAGGAVLA
ncbi:hypothetical protein GCM10027575_27630 [Phytohabitans suffuscus]